MPPGRRPRAPTINIDTSAVGGPNDQESFHMNQVSNHSQGEEPPQTPPQPQSPTLAVTNNLTSPENFLSVPSKTARTRADSFDSQDETAVAASSTGEASPFPTVDHDYIDDPHALDADPGTEAEFYVENNKFAFTPGQLGKLYHPKSWAAFRALGGAAGLEKGLRTDLKSGLNPDETTLEGEVTFTQATGSQTPPQSNGVPQITPNTIPAIDSKSDRFIDRTRVFGVNRLPERKAKSIFQLAWQAYKDKILLLLTGAAIISLAIGIYQAVDQGEASEYVEGVAIVIAIFIVVMVGAVNDWQKERQFIKLNRKKDDRRIKVMRAGRLQEISVFNVVVGDLVLLETGDSIPVDGIFVEGHDVKCDESSATGESDLLRKTAATEVYQAIEKGQSVRKMDPFILSGTKVAEGYGKFIVTAVGVHSAHGKTMMSLREEAEVTPLQSKLNIIAEYIAKLGGAAVLLYFSVAFIEFLVNITSGVAQSYAPADKGQVFLNIFIVSVSVIVVAVPEGLPLAVTLALAFATTRMLKDNNLVRLLRSCETMGNATTICSDKTGTLTQNVMTVVAGTFGTSSRFGDKPNDVKEPGKPDDSKGKNMSNTAANDVSAKECVSALHGDVKQLLLDSVSLNSTAFESEEEGHASFVGSKTETALLGFARDHLAMGPLNVERENTEITQMFSFDSKRKCMAVVIKKAPNQYRLLVKGASEILLARCSQLVRSPTTSIVGHDLDSEAREMLQHTISVYASRSLRTIGVSYKDFECWPPKGARMLEDDKSQVDFESIHQNMIMIGVIGIQDPLRPSVSEAVKDCKRAGVMVRMVTGDNVQTAKAIAAECGIYTQGGIVLEGPAFRKLSRRELDDVLPKLQVLARSSPDDKRRLVQRLKDLGECVAVTGDGTNDAPALKLADVGFSMGIAGTEVAKEASDIILMDDNFGSIVKALMWGRAVNDAVKKFLQFQITVNIVAVVLTFVSGIYAGARAIHATDAINEDSSAVLTAVQLLWVNLIMDTMAALALATDPPLRSILDRKPDRKSQGLISVTMWKMILGQALYQLIVLFIFYFAGAGILSYGTEIEQHQLQTMIFNMFVWMQIFNAFNNRRLDNNFNIFEGITKNWFFIGIIAIMAGGQILIMFVGGTVFNIYKQRAAQWGYALVLGFLSIPIGCTIRLIPDGLVLALIPRGIREWVNQRQKAKDEEAQQFQWNPALEDVRHELLFLKKFKGGRLNQLAHAVRHPREYLPGRLSSASRSRSSTLTANAGNEDERTSTSFDSRPASHRRSRSRSTSGIGALVVAPGIVGGSIGGWSPVEISEADRANDSRKGKK